MQTPQDLYAVLHVLPAATQQEISRSYRRLLRAHHPDLQPDDQPEGTAPAAAGELHLIMHAYAILGNPRDRADYDRVRAARGNANTDPGSPAGGHVIPVRIRSRHTPPFPHDAASGSPLYGTSRRSDDLEELLMAFISRYFR